MSETDNRQLSTDNSVVERDALLFRAGSYPDKDLDITEEDLDRMVESFTPAPIKVEHTDTPLRLGILTRIWRVGRELFGRLAFNPLAWALAKECGATRLSVAVRKGDGAKHPDDPGHPCPGPSIAEVSLVRSPRIADAAVFTCKGCVAYEGPEKTIEYFAGEELSESMESEGGESMERVEGRETETQQPTANSQQPTDVDAKIAEFKRQGRLVPAAEPLARALLGAGDEQAVTFQSESSASVAGTFEEFLKAQPPVIEFAERAAARSAVGGRQSAVGSGEAAYSAEDERFFEKLGVTVESVSRNADR